MSELLELIAKNLVDNKDEVNVTQKIDEDGAVRLTLKVSPSDIGKVIGKHGKIAKSIRAILKVAAINEGVKVYVEIE